MNKNEGLNYSDDLIQSTMLTKIDPLKTVFVTLKNIFLHPFKNSKIVDFKENVFFGYTDHPLDMHGVAPNTGFSFLRAFKGRKSSSLLSVKLRERKNNSFVFEGRGYNVFKIRDLDVMFQHRYVFDEKTTYDDLVLNINFLREDVYRLTLTKGDSTSNKPTPMIANSISDPNIKMEFFNQEDRYVMTTQKLRLELFKNNCRIDVYDNMGNLITESSGKTKDEFPMHMDCYPLGFVKDRKSGNEYGVESFVLYPGEAIWGLGENFGPVNKVGRTVGMWNYEGLGNTSGRTYKNIPFFMSSRGYGVFVNDSRPVTFWVGSRETCKNMFSVENGGIDYFFFYGPSLKNVLSNYTALTGRASMPPEWSFGTWMSRISYFSQEQVMAVATKLRDMNFPADVIHIDTGWFDEDWRCDWKFNRERFPDPEKMFIDTAEMGFHICLWQIPYVIKETSIYKDAEKKKAIAKNNGPFVWLWNYESSPIDFSREEGVEWYKEQLRPLITMGAASIKTDFGEQVEPFTKFKEYDGQTMHNLFPLLYQKAAYEALEEIKGKGEAVIWARSAWAGSQRYPVHWSGDNSSNHENLLSCLRGGLSLGLRGFTFWSHDTGGFVGIPDDELYIRWTQLSIFQSHIRYHGCPPHYKEPWNFQPETQRIARDYLNLRYSLIPYIYTESYHAANEGLPVLRHLALEFQNDPSTYYIEDQFLCGRYIMVAPILEKNNNRKLYLPEGIWYDFWSGEQIEGKQWLHVKVDLEKIPVYIREGIALPLVKPVQHTGDLTLNNMTIAVYPDANGEATYNVYHKGDWKNIRAHDDATIITVSLHKNIESAEIKLPRLYKNRTVNIDVLEE